ncbi:MbnP family copper-binding protein [Colwellia hornerae]|uniref:Metallo-mystery pair system four-Cys motif protein n=1 Tax=Colwellia hornerae TaxID=89402 RepID=A0A5C6QUS3_9GAMM|nr:MbnP family copper-binding protein [Colwellia hornerae]TWX57029.1 metallo-mystery pair system four-Cys motif protein [Colwellia hornerae]TWX62246.1 metallo-mystery pair system four-Cys motif protein [Colwellia hornerae]TWX72422.1 metallo-mystery pair system four-Cys motif protein [Colwellia hornerae]
MTYILNKSLSGAAILLLSVTLLSGCFQKEKPTTLTFTPVYKEVALNCASNFSGNNEQALGVASTKWQYQQLQFFIHDVEVNTKKSGWQPWLMTTNAHQAENIALLGEECNREGHQDYWQLELTPLNETRVITDIRFTLGVPFALNHLNPLTQPSPLNEASMFWGWQGGHKFIRAELASPDDDWLFHLGSTGCKALSPVRAPKSECLYPNRVVISLPFTSQITTIEFDLAALIADIALTRANSCQSAVDEESCKVLFKNLGINTNNTDQSMLFKTNLKAQIDG